MSKIKIIFSILILSLTIVGCASKKDEAPKDAETLYMQGYKYIVKTSYKRSADAFEKVEIEHPYSKWAVKAKIMGAFAHYKAKQYDDAIMALDRFIRFHPGNKDVAYAYYLKARCYYDQIGVIEKDQSATENALNALSQVILRFPNSDYAKDAEAKIDLARDYLAGQEMEIGYYYLTQKNYLSALNRFSIVVNEYQTTSYIEEALYRQIEVYIILGLNKEAENNAKILNYNYQESAWTHKANKIIKG